MRGTEHRARESKTRCELRNSGTVGVFFSIHLSSFAVRHRWKTAWPRWVKSSLVYYSLWDGVGAHTRSPLYAFQISNSLSLKAMIIFFLSFFFFLLLEGVGGGVMERWVGCGGRMAGWQDPVCEMPHKVAREGQGGGGGVPWGRWVQDGRGGGEDECNWISRRLLGCYGGPGWKAISQFQKLPQITKDLAFATNRYR